MALAIRSRKTEHAGAKHGNGAYWGPKWIAKKASNRERRRSALEAARAVLPDNFHGGRSLKNTRRWCRGKVGRAHAFRLDEVGGVRWGLPPLYVWKCEVCGRIAYNLKLPIPAERLATLSIEGEHRGEL